MGTLERREREKAELQTALEAEQQRAKALDAKIAELTGQLTAAQEALAPDFAAFVAACSDEAAQVRGNDAAERGFQLALRRVLDAAGLDVETEEPVAIALPVPSEQVALALGHHPQHHGGGDESV